MTTAADAMKIRLTKNDTCWLTLATALIAWLVPSYAIEPGVISRLDSDESARLRFDPASPQTNFSRIHTKTRHEIGKAFGKFPLSFEANHGQWDPQVKFLSRGRGYTLSLAANEAAFHFWTGDRESRNEQTLTPSDSRPARLFSFFQISAPELSRVAGRDISQPVVNRGPLDRRPEIPNLPSRSVRMSHRLWSRGSSRRNRQAAGDYQLFIGNNPEKWRTNIPNYSRVRYRDIYPGIDLVYYGNPEQLEYDVVVAPGVDPQSFLMAFDGADHLSINENGDLVMEIAGSQILQHKPQVYQWIKGKQRNVPGEYRLTREMQVAFSVGDHDVTKPVYSILFSRLRSLAAVLRPGSSWIQRARPAL